VGDATRGFGLRQPGSWLYSILPYIDEMPLFQMSASAPPTDTTNAGKLMWQGVVSTQGAKNMIGTPLSCISCPTRRPAVAYPQLCFFLNPPGPDRAPMCVKGDYAANAGDMMLGTSIRLCPDNGPLTLELGDQWTAKPGLAQWAIDAFPQDLVSISTGMPLAWGPTPYNGIVFQRSEVTMAMIKDGTTNTYLVGEKYCCPNFYTANTDDFDSESPYNGDDDDNERTGWGAPIQDTLDYYPLAVGTISLFGSAHDSGLNMAFCDGSVHQISYSIDSHVPGASRPADGHGYVYGHVQSSSDPPGVHQRLANRLDGWPIESDAY
jgi:prepilin-type processing-associated H-X9-DG protein